MVRQRPLASREQMRRTVHRGDRPAHVPPTIDVEGTSCDGRRRDRRGRRRRRHRL